MTRAMDQVPYSASWLSQWRDEITDALSCMILDLLTFYESIGEVVLPDVGNGCFIHSARDVLDRLAEDGAVFLPEADDPHGMVIASNGGGNLYVADWGGAIHRSRTASMEDAKFDKIADSVPEFLDHMRNCVVRFVRTGATGELQRSIGRDRGGARSFGRGQPG
ncbi:hypothetical protein ACFXPN_29275 [Streptomyces griseorubiginosus]|uniref:hypothetical protein n=1 Tax=Streptomyces griseorubiginosus TaxID=67304 RepID=UPI0036A9C3A9